MPTVTVGIVKDTAGTSRITTITTATTPIGGTVMNTGTAGTATGIPGMTLTTI